MQRSIVVILLVLVLGSPCTAAEEAQELKSPPEGIGALPAELTEAIESFYSAIESDDVETRIALFSDDIVMMPNHWTINRGVDPVATGLRSVEGAVFRIRDREVVKASWTGDVAYTVNSYYYTYHTEGDEPQWHKTKNVHIWKRDGQGRWKLHVDIWNSDVPIQASSEVVHRDTSPQSNRPRVNT